MTESVVCGYDSASIVCCCEWSDGSVVESDWVYGVWSYAAVADSVDLVVFEVSVVLAVDVGSVTDASANNVGHGALGSSAS